LKTPDITPVVIDMAVEDWTGLWEVIWHLNTDYPELAPEQKEQTADHAIRDLLARGLIRLVNFEEIGNEEQAIPGEDTDHVLQQHRNWLPPAIPFSKHVRFVATEAGIKIWRQNMGLEPPDTVNRT
jgi:hypothetical protein